MMPPLAPPLPASARCSTNSAADARFRLEHSRRCKGGRIHLNGLVAHPDGTKVLRETREGDDPVRLGEEVGETLLSRGGDVILEEVYGEGFALPQQP